MHKVERDRIVVISHQESTIKRRWSRKDGKKVPGKRAVEENNNNNNNNNNNTKKIKRRRV